ncbi:MAG: HAMP domain-containing sensor histidine kinase [Bacteroidota bacterium]|nr:HAMP domain-containing sensor histidine kinase [Bacteroidota bacterium]MDP4214211.1 HAMP domain-containing sensor histidine kinase [Bacteroidota bacterium]MDP4249549.1 HAMP domain-containing sensor histidine kinase [Bacteroidota bacterium]
MKSSGISNAFHEKQKFFTIGNSLERLKKKWPRFSQKVRNSNIPSKVGYLSQKSYHFLEEIKSLGFTKTMDELEKGKLSIFNQLNFFQFLTGIIVPLICFFGSVRFPLSSFFMASLPAWVSLLVLYLNFYYRYEAGMITYFVLYPLVTSIVYMSGLNLGVELFFILNGILAVFFLPLISQMLFSVGLTMISYFVLVVLTNRYDYQLHSANQFLYFFNQVTAILFIFYALFLIKKENNLYQVGILATNKALQETNEKIERQKTEIEEKAAELGELNSLKNKLFSVISHDMKTPMYALRNLFGSMQQSDMSGEEIKAIIPDVVTDLNYTTGLMENLLHWVKSQMNSAHVSPQLLNIGFIIEEAVNVQKLQASSKKISIRCEIPKHSMVYADKDAVTLVLRNLISNAIKFTPASGKISVRLKTEGGFSKISILDNGIGMDTETIGRIHQNNYYSTHGTAKESGTGLGLMLCKEFLARNGASLTIESEPGKGSTFSFLLPVSID